MEFGPFWEKMLVFLAPFTPYLRGTLPFNPLISACILGLLAFFLIRGHRRYELLRMETEDLLRRYMVFRGKKHSLLRGAKTDQGTCDEILRSISRSWHNFEEYHAQKIDLFEVNYREMKRGLLLGSILLVLNTLREGVAGLLITGLPSGFFSGLFQDLPLYFLVVVGFALLRIQKEDVYGTSSNQINPALETLFADLDRDDPLLYEEFDPLEGGKRGN
ncbi:MAG: hypothetical protein JRI46_01170 [Deltaproteobacteria bacterium]|nr:hypothetical protein [Deltaproteobacteria bacterium]